MGTGGDVSRMSLSTDATRDLPVVGALGPVGLALVGCSVLVALVGYGALGDRMRIHWTLGLGPYVGPEHAPTVLVLAAFPLLVAATFLGFAALAAVLRDVPEFGAAEPYYRAAALGTLAMLVLAEAALVALNL